MTARVLDTSALMAVLFAEPGAERVLEILEGATQESDDAEKGVLVPFIALMEVESWLRRRLADDERERLLLLLGAWPVRIEESSPDWRHEAARVKATTPLSVADAWIAALATLHGAALVHKDPEFDHVSDLKVERLPYKRGSG